MRLVHSEDYSHYFKLKKDNQTIERFDKNPNIYDIREAERKYGKCTERIDLWKSGLICIDCETKIDGRFGTDMTGNFLCWECAMKSTDKDKSKTAKVTDPTKSVLSKSNISFCDYVLNVATGCKHGCRFCYVPHTPNISARQDMIQKRTGKNGKKDWGSYILYRDDLPERLGRKLKRKRKWEKTDCGKGAVLISSGTDPYQDKRTAQITRGCLTELIKYEKPVRILTRSPLVRRDVDLFKKSKKTLVGLSIPCLDDESAKAIEPKAPVPSSRLKSLKEIKNIGSRVYVCISPTYPTMDKNDIESLLKEIKEIDPEAVFHEPMNPKQGNFDIVIKKAKKTGQRHLEKALKKINDQEKWVEYSLNHIKWVEEISEKLELDIYFRLDKNLIRKVSKFYPEKIDYLKKYKDNPEDGYFNKN